MININGIKIRHDKLNNGNIAIQFQSIGKVKYDESDREQIESELKKNLDILVNFISNDREFIDKDVLIRTDWNILEKVSGPAFDKFLGDREDDFFIESKFKYAIYNRIIEFQ